MDLRGLAELAGEMDSRSRPDTPNSDPDGEFDDRSVRLEITFGRPGPAARLQLGAAGAGRWRRPRLPPPLG